MSNSPAFTPDFIDSLLEAIIFEARGSVSIDDLEEHFGKVLSRGIIEEGLNRIEKRYFQKSRGIILWRNEKEVQFIPNPQYGPFVEDKMKGSKIDLECSRSEQTILAYLLLEGPKKQNDIDELFSKDTSHLSWQLRDKGFIQRNAQGQLEITEFFFFFFGTTSEDQLREYLMGPGKENMVADFSFDENFFQSTDIGNFESSFT